ncbi:MAG: hypothetical protein JWQ35_1917 [Bacteriovoracaceae bacterium]|nr:hypothetical protein [Bacteriovoracaceae bacterium]
MNQAKRNLKPIRNYPGIYKIWLFSKRRQKWIDTGKFLATRRIVRDTVTKRESSVFPSLPEALDYRAERPETLIEKDLSSQKKKDEGTTFGGLLQEWKAFHFLRIELGTRKLYERKLFHFRFLEKMPVEQIQTSTIDELVKLWMTDYPRRKGRQNFDKELKILRTIFHFYQSRKSPHYLIPVKRDHFEAATLIKTVKNDVKALTQIDLMRFLAALKEHANPVFFPLALTQFCLGLRVGEACGLTWEAVDLKERWAKIEQVIIWDDRTWEPSIKVYPKNQSLRFVSMPDVLVQELEMLRSKFSNPRGLIFTTESREPLNRQKIGRCFNQVLKNLGISFVTGTHFLRRTFATMANELTGDFYAVSKVLDHASTDVTQRYVRPMLSQNRKVSDAINGAFLPQCSSQSVGAGIQEIR